MTQYKITTSDPYSNRDSSALVTYYSLGVLQAPYTGFYFPPPYQGGWSFYVQAPGSGPADDNLIGEGTKDDRLFGSIGVDTLSGVGGDDLLVGGDGNDTLNGDDGNDTLYGDRSNGHLNIRDSNNVNRWQVPDTPVPGVTGDDILDGGEGADTLYGGFGNDQLHGGPRGEGFQDVLVGGPGADGFFLTYDPASQPDSGSPGFVSYWTAWAENYAIGEAKTQVKTGIVNLAKMAAKDFFETSIGGTILGGVTTVAANYVEKGLKLLFGMDKSAPPDPPPQGEDVIVITDFDPREDVVILPITDDGKTLTASATHFQQTPVGGPTWGVEFKTTTNSSVTLYAELLFDPAFLSEFGLTPNSSAVEALIGQLFASVVEIDNTDDPTFGGLVQPGAQYPFSTDPSDYVDDELPDVADTPIPFQAPPDTRTTIYGAFGPQFIKAPVTSTTTTLVGATNMSDIVFIGENGFAPDFWDNASVIAQPPGPSRILGFDGDDVLNGAAGQDAIYGGDGDDLIYGWNAANSPNRDQLYGEAGDDTLFAAKPRGGRAAASFDGGDGDDTASFYYSRYAVTANLNTGVGANAGDVETNDYSFLQIENLIGTDYNDVLTGDDSNNLLQGHVGNDKIVAGDGDDRLEGGPLPPALYRVGAGGPNLPVTDGGPTWGGDTTDNPNDFLSGTGLSSAATTADILYDADTAFGVPERLFAFYRQASQAGQMIWDFPVYAIGTYTVNLYLVEGSLAVDGAGQRVFDVQVEGVVPKVFDDIDPWTLGGAGNDGTGNNVFIRSYDVEVDDGDLRLQFLSSGGTGNRFGPAVQGIEIVPKETDDDTLDGGGGVDWALYGRNSGRIVVDLNEGVASEYGVSGRPAGDRVVSTDTLSNIENIEATAYDDTLTGDSNDNVFVAGAGDNVLDAGDGNDTWSTEGGTEDIVIDMVGWSGGQVTQPNSFGGTDTLTGFESVIAGEGDDKITGNSDDNVLTGRAGNDVISGGGGSDTVDFADGDRGVNIDLWDRIDGVRSGRWTDAFGDSDTIDRGTIESYSGTSGNDVMAGDGGSRQAPWSKAVFNGEGGDDTLTGSGNDDVLDGGDGDDLVNGLAGSDQIRGGAGDDHLIGGSNESVAVVLLNAYGPEINNEWQTDKGYITEQSGGGADATAQIFYDASKVNNAPVDLFKTYQAGFMDWEMPVYGAGTNPGPNQSGTYTVNLFFAEPTPAVGTGQRRFSVAVEGAVPQVFDDIDVYSLAGGNNGGQGNGTIMLSHDVVVKDGSLSLEFTGTTARPPIISAIEVIQKTVDDDQIWGDDGNDLIAPGQGWDWIDGGTGIDIVSYIDNPGKIEGNLGAGAIAKYDEDGGSITDSVENVEGIQGSVFADTLKGDNGNNILTGYLGDDLLDGMGGTDTADYSVRTTGIRAFLSDADSNGTQTLQILEEFNRQATHYEKVAETDTLTSIEALNGTLQDDEIYGSTGADTISGDAGNDILVGNADADALSGGDGDDILYGGTNGILYRANATGEAVAALDDGPDWAAEEDYFRSGTPIFTPTETTLFDRINLALIPTEPFARVRDGQAFADFPVTKGYYAVNVFMAEPFTQQNRDYSIFINNVAPDGLSNINPWAIGGSGNNGAGNQAIILSSGPVEVTGSTLTVHFPNRGTNVNPVVNALEILGFNTAADGKDTMDGGAGNDTLFGYDGNDILEGGDGKDTTSYLYNKGKVDIDLSAGQASEYGADGGPNAETVLYVDVLSNIENITGSLFDDSLEGDNGANVLAGAGGADELRGNGGLDSFVGTAAELAGDTIADLEDGETIHIREHLGDVEIVLGKNLQTRLRLDGNGDGVTDGVTRITGDFSALELDRLLVQRQPNDRDIHVTLLDRVSGRPIVDGGDGTSGDDLLYGSIEHDLLAGHAGDDVVDGNAGNDKLFGGSGDDVMRGEDGNDFILGGSGDDNATGGRGRDRIEGASGDDRLDGGDGRDCILGGSGDDVLLGGDGNDRLSGGSGDDLLAPGAGRFSTLTGGAGGDIFLFGAELADGERGWNRISDFRPGRDAIDLGGFEVEHVRETDRFVALRVGPDHDLVRVDGIDDVRLLSFVEETLI